MIHVFHTIPVVGILIMYVSLLWVLKKRRDKAKKNMADVGTDLNMKMTQLVQRVVLFLLVCYVPFLGWKHYFIAITVRRIPFGLNSAEVS